MKSLKLLPGFLFLLSYITTDLVASCTTSDCPSSSDFIQLRNEPYFIDKTDFIKHFFEDDWHSYTFISTPRGFCKTTNLQMIQLFAGIELDENRNIKDPADTKAYETFENLTIFDNTQIVNDHLAKYVIIHLDLKSDTLFSKYTNETAVQFLGYKLYKIFEPYKWLLDLPQDELLKRERYRGFLILEEDINFMTNLSSQVPCDEQEIISSLHRIAYILMVYFQREVIILVDNYDSVLSQSNSITKEGVLDFYGIIGEMIRKALTQPVTVYGLVTSVSGLILPKIRKTINRATHYRFLGEHRLNEYFGFTETDVTDLITRYDLPQARVSELNSVYGGYQSVDDLTLFHPESIVKYVQDSEANQNYRMNWRLSDEDNFVKSVLRDRLLRQILENVVDKLTCRFTYAECYEDYEDLESFFDIRLPIQFDKMYQDISLSYIHDHGYLTWTRVQDEFIAPNSQARYSLRKILESFAYGPVF
ncbi:uncharacterized protein LOC135845888 [Planococcus citri]|uniref:uncharacterized protein LOC135845888 n=1 Tax=Planococcus citri TaxID=170843 RepID=UPI0031F74C33